MINPRNLFNIYTNHSFSLFSPELQWPRRCEGITGLSDARTQATNFLRGRPVSPRSLHDFSVPPSARTQCPPVPNAARPSPRRCIPAWHEHGQHDGLVPPSAADQPPLTPAPQSPPATTAAQQPPAAPALPIHGPGETSIDHLLLDTYQHIYLK